MFHRAHLKLCMVIGIGIMSATFAVNEARLAAQEDVSREVAELRKRIGQIEVELRSVVPFGSDPASRLLAQMDRHSAKKEYAEAINVGMRIEEIDKYGDKYIWTAGVYANLAMYYAALGNKAEKVGDLKTALENFKRAGSCNRSFADAIARYRLMSGHSREHTDEVLKSYK